MMPPEQPPMKEVSRRPLVHIAVSQVMITVKSKFDIPVQRPMTVILGVDLEGFPWILEGERWRPLPTTFEAPESMVRVEPVETEPNV
jgi:hypothetical protein